MKRNRAPVPPKLRILLERLSEAGIFREFYLAGGTGLALLLSHRRSVDLDLFSRTNRLDFEGRGSLLRLLTTLPGWSASEAKDGTLHGKVGAVRLSFFWFPSPLLKPLIHRGSVRIASLEDIGLMKIGAVIGRGSRKDFVDLYEICQHIPLARLLALAARKYKDSRDFALQALKALSFFEDADREPPLQTVKPLAWKQVRTFFAREVQSASKRYVF